MSAEARIAAAREALGRLAPKGYVVGLHIRFAAPLLTYLTFDPTWVEHYVARGYMLRDPVVSWGFGTTGTIRWSDEALRDPAGLFLDAAKFGLRYGVTVACGPSGSRTIGSLARDDREYSDTEIAAIVPVIQQLHDLTRPPEGLTRAEIEALRRIAAGDRHAAAAARLGISESALKARLASARQRLEARTTLEAIQRARSFRLI